jgi:hypothetical protein
MILEATGGYWYSAHSALSHKPYSFCPRRVCQGGPVMQYQNTSSVRRSTATGTCLVPSSRCVNGLEAMTRRGRRESHRCLISIFQRSGTLRQQAPLPSFNFSGAHYAFFYSMVPCIWVHLHSSRSRQQTWNNANSNQGPQSRRL